MKTTTNGLLFVIAVCLVLMTLRLYDVGVVSTANAQTEIVAAEPLKVRLYGQHSTLQGQINNWIPVKVNQNGELVVAKDTNFPLKHKDEFN